MTRFFQRYKKKDRCIFDRFVTDNDIWVHHYEPESKRKIISRLIFEKYQRLTDLQETNVNALLGCGRSYFDVPFVKRWTVQGFTAWPTEIRELSQTMGAAI